jgi:PTS system nitrogen regulatory IIA component
MTRSDQIAQLMVDSHIDLNARAATKARLLKSLAARAAEITGLAEESLASAVMAREALGSTGFGAGVAAPHARIEGLASPLILFWRLEKPVAFEAIDDKPVDIVVLLLTPAGAQGDHLGLLAALSRRLRDRPAAQALREAQTPAAVRATLCGG